MVPIDMSQYDCPYERNCMMNDKRELNFAIKITYRRRLDLKWYKMK